MAADRTFSIVVQIKARSGLGDQYEAMMKELIDRLAKEDCFVGFDVVRDALDRDRFLFLEHWTDRDRYLAIRDREYFRRYVEERRALIEPEFDRSEWEGAINVHRRG